MVENINEARMFSERANSPKYFDKLVGSSVSVEDAKCRMKHYSNMFNRYQENKEQYKLFSGYSETPILSTQYFNASVAAYVSSFAGFMSIERDMDQPNALLEWLDVLGVSDLRKVMPNLGPDQFNLIGVMGKFTTEIDVTADASYSYLVGRKIIPGSARIKISRTDASGDVTKVELVDAGQGEFMAKAGVITESSIDYRNGKIQFTLAEALDPNKKDTCVLVAAEDTTGTPNFNVIGTDSNGDPMYLNRRYDNRFMAKMEQIGLSTVPDMLSAEYNITSLAAMKKAIGTDMATFLFTKLREMYTKLINSRLVTTLADSYQGDTMYYDLSVNSQKYHDFRSNLDFFNAIMIDVESELAKKSVKGITTTAYIAGANSSNMFQKCSAIGKFEKNEKATYINDLLGWFDGIPVLRSTDIGNGDIYAIHKTPDGQMAPLVRGIYLPLTDCPNVGNYNNPTQMASGIYYQEGILRYTCFKAA